MNYRHHYHAGNFADVVKHLIVLALVEAMQRKPKGFFMLDTTPDAALMIWRWRTRGIRWREKPEWPDGWGRLSQAGQPPDLVQRYLEAVTAFGQSGVFPGANPYPGSPCLVAPRLREQDRATWCEWQPDEFGLLRDLMVCRRGWRVEQRDGYEAIRGCLPPMERRALVLIDPPYEAENESEQVWRALQEGLRRLPGGTFAIWYPLTARVGDPVFLRRAHAETLPPTWTAELTVAGPDAAMAMRGAGVMVVNPPWQLDQALGPTLQWLARQLAQRAGGAGILRWLVPER